MKILASDLSEFECSTPILTLDCFDTIFWRRVKTPHDIFYLLQEHPLYKQYGFSASDRGGFESQARLTQKALNNSTEVRLEDIYRHGLQLRGVVDKDGAIVQRLVALEIAIEIEHGVLFKPLCALIERAQRKGCKVVVVSDTYFSVAQLTHLLNALQANFTDRIDRIYTSSESGSSKVDRLFEVVMADYGVAPSQITHLGDNITADFLSPVSKGIHAHHLIQFDLQADAVLNAKTNIGLQLLPQTRYRQPFVSNSHVNVAQYQAVNEWESMGFNAIGSILHSFALFVKQQLARGDSRHRKIAFLMRDGYLPQVAFQACVPEIPVSQLRVSRFTAIASSFVDRASIERHIDSTLYLNDVAILAKQLQLSPSVRQRFLDEVTTSYRQGMSVRQFMRSVLLKEIYIDDILQRSAQLRERLKRHIFKQTGAQTGDEIVLVDLGYVGTVQNYLNEIADQWGLRFSGLYLVTQFTHAFTDDKKGLIQYHEHDPRLIETLLKEIRVFESICSIQEGSVIGYDEDGTPVLADLEVNLARKEAMQSIERGVVRYCAVALAQLGPLFEPSAEETIIDLARLIYAPTPSEVALMSQFEFEHNLGSDSKVALFDQQLAMSALEDYGMSYVNAGEVFDKRSHLPYELRYSNYLYSNIYMLANRYALFVKEASNSYHQPSFMTVHFFADGTHSEPHNIEAYPTTNGFYILKINAVAGMKQWGIWWSPAIALVQIKSVMLIDANQKKQHHRYDFDALVHQQVTPVTENIYKLNAEAITMVNMDHPVPHAQLAIVFRPLNTMSL